jgi:hypothetical protein
MERRRKTMHILLKKARDEDPIHKKYKANKSTKEHMT